MESSGDGQSDTSRAPLWYCWIYIATTHVFLGLVLWSLCQRVLICRVQLQFLRVQVPPDSMHFYEAWFVVGQYDNMTFLAIGQPYPCPGHRERKKTSGDDFSAVVMITEGMEAWRERDYFSGHAVRPCLANRTAAGRGMPPS